MAERNGMLAVQMSVIVCRWVRGVQLTTESQRVFPHQSLQDNDLLVSFTNPSVSVREYC